MTLSAKRAATALLSTLVIHGALLAMAMLLHLPDPPIDRGPIMLHFMPEAPALRNRSLPSLPPAPPAPADPIPTPAPLRPAPPTPADPTPRPTTPPPALPPTGRATLPATPDPVRDAADEQKTTSTSDIPVSRHAAADSAGRTLPAGLRSVLARPLSAEEAWSILGQLMEEYPQFREMVRKEMIAGSGLPADSLPRIDLRYEQMLRKGLRPSWDAQRHVIEEAFKSFDAVHGWTNKGGYGPTINVIGLIRFLLDLIEGK